MRALALILAVFVASAAVPASAAAPRVAFRITDPRIDEASGIAPGVRSPGIDYVQNDSGDTNRFFAIDAATGATAATVTVPGATNVDWEDIAVAPDSAGTSSVWLADTGDNTATRSEVRIYRVAEPDVATGDRDRPVRAGRADVWRLRYPGGPVDAESLAVTPRGVAYIVTKSLIGASVVYRVPARPDVDHVQTLVPVGTIRFTAHRTAIPFGELGTLTATSASISADGSLLAVRTYADAYLWRLAAGDVAAALRAPATRVTLPVERQGEGIAFRGTSSLLVDSEGVGEPVYEVPVPSALLVPLLVPMPSPAAPAPMTGASATGSSASGTPAGGAGARGSSRAGSGPGSGPVIGLGVVAAVLILVAGTVMVRRRRAR